MAVVAGEESPLTAAALGISWPSSFGWGVFGAILPEIPRFKKLIEAAAVGVFAVAWKPEHPFKAIWVGISFPILVLTLMQATPSIIPSDVIHHTVEHQQGMTAVLAHPCRARDLVEIGRAHIKMPTL